MPFWRSNSIRASSVSLLPRPRIRDMTAERFALVNTSAMRAFQGKFRQFSPPVAFVGRGIFYLIAEAGPFRLRRIKFRLIEFVGFRTPPGFGGKTPQDAGPAAFGIIKAVGMQSGEKIGDG